VSAAGGVAPRIPPDLVTLAAQYPELDFGSASIASASGTDRRYVWAKARDGTGSLCFGWSAHELADHLKARAGDAGETSPAQAGEALPRALPTPSGAEPGLPCLESAEAPGYQSPFTLAMRAGRCPLCLGSGEVGMLAICLHDPPICDPGAPCHLCLGTGRWPPPGGFAAESEGG
jgi:hypothetical protein